ncbi:MAG: ectonucleotide pyrophosphatase/phosphodiesterase [Eubacteriales bacterium]|nr:ectonucleotide pyrophosphatase/phosphodiesterase [Eubacteriales bacterium]
MKKKKLIVFSADALVTEDLEHLKTLPNYKKYLAGGCEVSKMTSVYPTITYPCHTTLCTGVYPNKHGVFGNLEFLPGVSPLPWFWDRKWNHCSDDLFYEAKKAGYSTAAVFWPVTGNHPAIDYLIDEYWTQSPQDTPGEAWRRMGSSDEMLDIVKRHIGANEIRKHPPTERFIIDCSCDIIRQFKPDVLFLHPANIDGYRHTSGLFNDRVTQGINETDQWIGELMDAVKDAGVFENTNFVLTSDHGQMNITRIVNINVLLKENGLIRLHEDGTLQDWDAWCLSGGMSALVFLKDPQNQTLYKKVQELLYSLRDEGVYGFSKVFTTEEVNEKEHLSGPFSFVLETDGYTSFGDACQRPLVTSFDATDYRYGHATHGYLPARGPQPTFLCKGPDFIDNGKLEEGRLIDQAPTFAKLLGVPLPEADGQPMDALLKGTQYKHI